jgi:hypothetical protein
MNISFLNQLIHVLKDQPEQAVVKISALNEGYCFDIEKGETHAILETMVNFKKIINEERLLKICSKPELQINPNSVKTNALLLTKDVVRKIFVGFADLNFHSNPMFDSSDPLAISSMDQLRNRLMGWAPSLESFTIDRPTTSGHGLKGLMERVFLTYSHYFDLSKVSEDKEKMKIRDIEFLTSRMADREFREGSIIPLSDGPHIVSVIFTEGGTYASILEAFNDAIPPKIICRGTARLSATQGLYSSLNNLLVEIGTMGVKAIWPRLARYLTHKNIKSVDLFGKSLGGAHAQELSILIEGTLGIKVNCLTTYCSVGVGDEINALFLDEVLGKRTQDPFNLCVIRNGGNSHEHAVDYVPVFGGVHIGYNAPPEFCKKEIIYIVPTDNKTGFDAQSIETISHKKSLCNLAFAFLRSGGTPHCRQSTLGKFAIKKIVHSDKKDKHLRSGNLLETYRKSLSKGLDVLTFYKLNGESFQAFYHKNR